MELRFGDDVIHYIADAIQSNMRTLEGALTRLIAYSSIMNAPITTELAQACWANTSLRSRSGAKFTIDEVIAAVAPFRHHTRRSQGTLLETRISFWPGTSPCICAANCSRR